MGPRSKRERMMLRRRGWKHGAASMAKDAAIENDPDYLVGYTLGRDTTGEFNRLMAVELEVTDADLASWVLRVSE